MFVNRVERITIRPGHANHAACRRLCVATRKVANVIWQQFSGRFFKRLLVASIHSPLDSYSRC